MGGTQSVITTEEEYREPHEESCETMSQFDEDELSSILQPVKERISRRQRRRLAEFQQRQARRDIVSGSNESDAAGSIERQLSPQPANVDLGSMLSKLQRFKIKAGQRTYGHARTFKLIKDTSRRRRDWRRHLSGDVIMSANFQRTYTLGLPTGGRYHLFKHHDKKKIPVGHIVCSGWIDGSLNFYDATKKQHGRMSFGSGYAGTLMRLHVRLPHRVPLDQDAITEAIIAATDGRVIYDLCHYISSFLCPKEVWSDVPTESFAGQNSLGADYVSYTNKKPSWNEEIRAYTLEFGGRALLPSVHNFQLARVPEQSTPQGQEPNEDPHSEQIHMQLGKLGTVNNTNNGNEIYFNCDVHTSLSKFHAFAIAICVMQRTFIAE